MNEKLIHTASAEKVAQKEDKSIACELTRCDGLGQRCEWSSEESLAGSERAVLTNEDE
jgi:hypothetical protein